AAPAAPAASEVSQAPLLARRDPVPGPLEPRPAPSLGARGPMAQDSLAAPASTRGDSRPPDAPSDRMRPAGLPVPATARHELQGPSESVVAAADSSRPALDSSRLAGDSSRLAGDSSRLAGDSSTPPADAGAPGWVVVKPGDSLWRLAEKHLGDALLWEDIYDLNSGPLPGGGTLRDPNLIHPGWRLRLPPPVAAASGTAGGPPS
ncbi:MAG: LysM peptidoglycan-binding domain-containing protein, partial [bacterium]|nr:LysM peptidoglycan-binding domain-containing protein [bacterium]